MTQANNVIRTLMSEAFINAVHTCGKQGRNAGRIGRIVVTNAAKGVGVKYAPRIATKK